jgi:hypothetical protein
MRGTRARKYPRWLSRGKKRIGEAGRANEAPGAVEKDQAMNVDKQTELELRLDSLIPQTDLIENIAKIITGIAKANQSRRRTERAWHKTARRR